MNDEREKRTARVSLCFSIVAAIILFIFRPSK
jgi:hypothetical protein